MERDFWILQHKIVDHQGSTENVQKLGVVIKKFRYEGGKFILVGDWNEP